MIVNTENNNIIKSDYAEYDKLNKLIKLKGNILASDVKNNIVESNLAEYDEAKQILKSIGKTKVMTSEKYLIEGEDIVLDNLKKTIKSNKDAIITDQDNNKIFLNSFEYHSKDNIFKSIGYVKIQDSKNNSYEFSQIYIDTQKKEILGTDIKAYMNDKI